MKKGLLLGCGGLLILALLVALPGVSGYNRLVSLEEGV